MINAELKAEQRAKQILLDRNEFDAFCLRQRRVEEAIEVFREESRELRRRVDALSKIIDPTGAGMDSVPPHRRPLPPGERPHA